jgi:BASS family bile acid:Na+ symporter
MTALLDGLALIARYGTQLFIASILIGLALPLAAATARPLLGVCIFLFITLTFARADLGMIGRVFGEPRRLALACLWLALAPAVVTGLALTLVGRESLDPGWCSGSRSSARPRRSCRGRRSRHCSASSPRCCSAPRWSRRWPAPALSPILADLVAGAAVPLDRGALAWRLAWFIGGAILVAFAARRLIGEEPLAARRRSIDGAGVVIYFVFAVAAMDGVTSAAFARPLLVAGFLAAAFAVSLACLLLTWIGLRPIGRGDRLMFGYAAGQRNMGVLIATLGASVPDTTFLFFALAQFPIYFMPQVLRSLAPWILGQDRGKP